MKKRFILPFLVVAAIGLLEVSGWAQGCALCRRALESQPDGENLRDSFNYGILFLMGVPYAMFGGAGIVIYRAFRKRALKKPDLEA